MRFRHISRCYSYQKWPADEESVVIATESYRSEFAGDSMLCLFKPKDPKSEKLEKVWLIWDVSQYSGEDIAPHYEAKDSSAADWIRRAAVQARPVSLDSPLKDDEDFTVGDMIPAQRPVLRS